MVDLFNQTTGGPRDVYRGAFEGLDEFVADDSGATTSARSLNEWKHMEGWETILTAHTSTLALCTELHVGFGDIGNVTFNRTFCYENVNASAVGPQFPNPRWSIIEDCCLKFNRTIGHGNAAFFWTDQPPLGFNGFCEEQTDAVGMPKYQCQMVMGKGLVVGRYGRILRTSDGGVTWTNVPSPTSAHLNAISFTEENTHSGALYDTREDVGWAVGDSGTIIRTDDRGYTWSDETNNVIQKLGTNMLRNGKRLDEVNLRAVKHSFTNDVIEPTQDGTVPKARAVMVVGDYSTILRYDPCAVITADGKCYQQVSDRWIDMSLSYYEDFYGDLYDVHMFDLAG